MYLAKSVIMLYVTFSIIKGLRIALGFQCSDYITCAYKYRIMTAEVLQNTTSVKTNKLMVA